MNKLVISHDLYKRNDNTITKLHQGLPEEQLCEDLQTESFKVPLKAELNTII